jgi:hypothetical protein
MFRIVRSHNNTIAILVCQDQAIAAGAESRAPSMRSFPARSGGHRRMIGITITRWPENEAQLHIVMDLD